MSLDSTLTRNFMVRWYSSDWWNPTDSFAESNECFYSGEGLGSTKPSVPAHQSGLLCSGERRAILWSRGVMIMGALSPQLVYQSPLSSDSSLYYSYKDLFKNHFTEWLIYYWWDDRQLLSVKLFLAFPPWLGSDSNISLTFTNLVVLVPRCVFLHWWSCVK